VRLEAPLKLKQPGNSAALRNPIGRTRNSLKSTYFRSVPWIICEWDRQIRMDQAVIDKVDAMWSELGLPGSGKKIWK